MLADLSAACLWLLRREVRCLDRACAGVEEGAARREHAMRTADRGLRTAGLEELQAAGGALKGAGRGCTRVQAAGDGGLTKRCPRRPPPTPLANFREGC